MTDVSELGTVPEWTVHDRLRKAREFAGLSQSELGEDVGISRRSISAYENGAATPNRPVLLSWALRCGVPLRWLNGGEWAPRGSNPQPTDYKMAFSRRRRAAA
jgi:transcriptional regulator with XRE-family HTH domain